MRLIDTIPAERRQQVTAKLQEDLRRAYAEADNEQDRTEAVALLEQLQAESVGDTDGLDASPVDSSHPDYLPLTETETVYGDEELAA